MEFNKFNYIGSKYKLLPSIVNTIEEKIGRSLEGLTIGDLFSGTAICSYKFRTLNCNVVSNDYEYYGYVIARAFSRSIYTENIEKSIKILNGLKSLDGIVSKHFSPNGNRMYFTVDNAKKIDSMRIGLEKMKKCEEIDEDEYYYLLCCILLAADKVANIASVYGAYLKKFKDSSLKDVTILPIHKLTKNTKNKVYNSDINEIISKDKYDIVYLDPPYNERQYSKNYHILNYIAMYEEVDIKGITGLLVNSNVSLFCKKQKILEQLEDLLKKVKTKWLFMSYNSESLVDKDKLIEVMSKHGEVSCKETEYKRFKSNNSKNQKKNIIEYLFCIKF
jgi:adenine-specific DNA-methyltransferase